MNIFRENRLINLLASQFGYQTSSNGTPASEVARSRDLQLAQSTTNKQNAIQSGSDAVHNAASQLNAAGTPVHVVSNVGSRSLDLVHAADGTYGNGKAYSAGDYVDPSVMSSHGASSSGQDRDYANYQRDLGAATAGISSKYNQMAANGQPIDNAAYQTELQSAQQQAYQKYQTSLQSRNQLESQSTSTSTGQQKPPQEQTTGATTGTAQPTNPMQSSAALRRSQRLGLTPKPTPPTQQTPTGQPTQQTPPVAQVTPPQITPPATGGTSPATGGTQTPPAGGAQPPPAAGTGTPPQGGTVTPPSSQDGAGAQTGQYYMDAQGKPILDAQGNPIPKPNGINAPTSLDALKQEQGQVAAPILGAEAQQMKNTDTYFDSASGQLKSLGDATDTYKGSATASVNDSLVRQKQSEDAATKQNLQLLKDSLDRQTQNENLTQEKVDRDFNRQEAIDIRENAIKLQNERTSLSAKYGGFGSTAGLTLIAQEGQRMQDTLDKLHEDHAYSDEQSGARLSQLETSYRTSVQGAFTEHDKAINDAYVAANTNAVTIDGKALDETATKVNSGLGVLKNVFDQYNTIEMATGKTLSDITSNALAQRTALRQERNGRIDQGFSNLMSLIGTYGNFNPGAIQGALKNLGNMGVDTTGFDPNAPTLDMAQKLGLSFYGQKLTGGGFVDPNTGEDVGQAIYNMAGTAQTPDQQMSIARQVLPLLQQAQETGDYSKVQAWRDNQAVQSMPNDARTSYQSTLDAQQKVIPTMNQLQDAATNSNAPLWIRNSMNQTLNNLGQSNDPKQVQLAAELKGLTIDYNHDYFGARLTETEISQTKILMPQLSDTPTQALAKLQLFQKFLEQKRQTLIGVQEGKLNTGDYPPLNPPDNNSANGILKGYKAGASSSASAKKSEAGGGHDPEVGTASFGNDSPLAQYVQNNGFRITQYYNGTYDQNHSQEMAGVPNIFSDNRATHESYNISPPNPGQKNVTAPAFKAGTVVKVQNSDKGYGNSIRVRDADGNTWIYGHLASINVKQGDQIAENQSIGIMGNSGYATGVTMHLEARDASNKPFDFALTQNPPRQVAMSGQSSGRRNQ